MGIGRGNETWEWDLGTQPALLLLAALTVSDGGKLEGGPGREASVQLSIYCTCGFVSLQKRCPDASIPRLPLSPFDCMPPPSSSAEKDTEPSNHVKYPGMNQFWVFILSSN